MGTHAAGLNMFHEEAFFYWSSKRRSRRVLYWVVVALVSGVELAFILIPARALGLI